MVCVSFNENTLRSTIGTIALRIYYRCKLSQIQMSNYRRPHVFGGTFFITQVTYQREPWLCCDVARKALREGIERVRVKYPFVIDAFVLWLSRNCSDRLSLWFLKSLHSRLFKKQTQKVLYHKRTLFTLFSGEPDFSTWCYLSKKH